MSERYVVGDSVVIGTPTGFTFTVAGVLTDPTTVTLIVTDPAGAATTYTWPGPGITRISVGTFKKELTVTSAGVYSFNIIGTGTAADAYSGTFTVFAVNPIANQYCTLDELKSWLGLGQTDVADDAGLQTIIGASSRWIDAYCRRRFYADTVPTARVYSTDNPYEVWIDDLASVTGLVVKTDTAGDGTYATTLAATDYLLLPENAPYAYPEAQPWDRLTAISTQLFYRPYGIGIRRSYIRMTGLWGWPAVPDAVKQACLMQSARLFKRRASPEGVAGFGEFGVVRVSRVDPDIGDLLQPYSLALVA